jgi:hypothetical protein
VLLPAWEGSSHLLLLLLAAWEGSSHQRLMQLWVREGSSCCRHSLLLLALLPHMRP